MNALRSRRSGCSVRSIGTIGTIDSIYSIGARWTLRPGFSLWPLWTGRAGRSCESGCSLLTSTRAVGYLNPRVIGELDAAH